MHLLKRHLESLSIVSYNDITTRVKTPFGTCTFNTLVKNLKPHIANWIKEDHSHAELLTEASLHRETLKALKEIVANSARADIKTDEESEAIKKNISKLKPVINVADIRHNFLYDPETRKVIRDIDFELYLQLMSTSVKDIVANGALGKPVFNPFKLDAVYIEDSMNFYNLYSPPKWRYLNTTADMPELFDLFFKHLFPNEEARAYVFHWLYHLITKRNQTYLCLVGARGIGKNILAEVAKALVGFEYAQTVGDSILNDKFNAPLKNSRLIHLDEIAIDAPEKFATLKRFANDTIAIEAKGKDSVTEENFTSMILSTNHITDVDMKPQERRFSMPELTEKDLRYSDIFPAERILELVETIKDPESDEVARLGNWILANGFNRKYVNEFTPYKGPYFYELCHLSLKEWQRFIVEKVISKEKSHYLFKDLQAEFMAENGERFGKYFPKVSSKPMIEFISDYAYEGKHKLGRIGKVTIDYRELSALIVNPVFAPEDSTEFKEVTNYEASDEGFLE